MAFTSQIAGAATALVMVFGVFTATAPPFLKVDGFDIRGEQVTVTRTVHGKGIVADWRVIIVKSGAPNPVCQTKAGPNMHQGWSVYSSKDSATQTFTIDDWVGDAGCYDRMPAGEYTQYVTWTPRGPEQPVRFTYTFKKETE